MDKNVCPRCDGKGWEPDKPWKSNRDWMPCSTCGNGAGLPEPNRAPREDEWLDDDRGSAFPRNSAFGWTPHERQQLEEFDKQIAERILPGAPVDYPPVLDLEELYSQLDRALSLIEGGDLNDAYPLVEAARDTIYRNLP